MKGIERIDIAAADLPGAAAELIAQGGRMQFAYAWYPEPGGIELRYLADRPRREGFVLWCVRPRNGLMPTLTGPSPMMSWYEREIADLFGMTFEGHPEPVPLVLSGRTFDGRPPMRADLVEDTAGRLAESLNASPQMVEGDVQVLPFGPIRADVVESVRLDFFYVGEHILHLYPQLFLKHRGMEQRFEGASLPTATALAERVSGIGSFCHALAFCEAVEAAAGCDVPLRARMLRMLMGELERVYNHLHYLGHLADTTTLKVGQAEGRLLEERAKQINARLTGSRFLRSVLKPGGLRRDLGPVDWLTETLETLRADAASYVDRLENTGSFLDRLMTTGPLPRRLAFDQGATGPIERASGLDRDLRRDYPYAAYARVPVEVPVRDEGDAYARYRVRVAELMAAIAIVQRVLLLIEDGPIAAACLPPPSSEGMGWCEGPRGGVFYAVHFDGAMRLRRVKIKSPSFSNWRVFPFTVHDSNMMDYAINEASFGLSVAGCDR